jgi:cell division inhibitor SepF
MGVFDRFINIMKLNDDDYDDYYYDDDDEFVEDYEPPKSRRQIFSKENAEDYPEEPKRERNVSSSNKVTPMRPPSRKVSSGMEVCVIKPNSVDDSREICETLLTNRTVILNLEGMDVELAQRIIDFISGAAFAISGNLQRISNYIFLVTPANVDISGDLQDLLGGGPVEPAPSRGGRY